MPPGVNSAYSTSPTISGLTHSASAASWRGMPTKGFSSVRSGVRVFSQQREGAVAEARPDASRVLQAVGSRDAEQERSDRARSQSLAGADGADHDLLRAGELDLEPRLGADAAPVRGCGILHDDPFESELPARCERGIHVVEDGRHHDRRDRLAASVVRAACGARRAAGMRRPSPRARARRTDTSAPACAEPRARSRAAWSGSSGAAAAGSSGCRGCRARRSRRRTWRVLARDGHRHP